MKQVYLTLIFLVLVYNLQAQQYGRLSGEVTSTEGSPLEFANLTLHNAIDSSFISYAVTDEEGLFEFHDLAAVKGFVVASYIGYAEYTTDTFTLYTNGLLKLPTIHISPLATELTEIKVTAKRKMIEIRSDKIVFNVEGTINAASGNALDLLRKSPGVVVTNSDDITLLGQPGVQIYIDGKPSPLGSSDLAAHLRTIPSTQIESIEIITNPSSRYDAEGSAGIINIRMKRDKNHGLNTSVYLGYSTGKKAWQYGSLRSNFRNKSINIFGEYGLNTGENISTRELIREQNGLTFDQSNVSLTEWVSNKFELGLDAYLNERSTLGLRVNGSYNDFFWTDKARTSIFSFGGEQPDSTLVSEYEVDGLHRNLMYNLNYRYVEPEGITLVFDIDISNYFNPNEGKQPNLVLNNNLTQILNQKNYSFNNPTSIDLYSVKGDLETNWLKGEFDMGMKVLSSQTNNLFDFYETKGNPSFPILDINRSNQFIYLERVSALYLNYSRDFDKMGFQIGLRGEHTFSRGKLRSYKNIHEDDVTRDYFDLFPSAGINYKVNAKNSLQLNYSRRITRPSYQDLNPFEVQKDEYNFERGNPYLTPEYTDKFQLTHAFNHKLYTSLAYSFTKDLIVRIRDTLSNNRTVRQFLNLAENRHLSLNIGLSHDFSDWWSSYHSITAYSTRNKGSYGGNQTIDLKARAVNFYGQHSFSLPKSFSFEISGWYNSPTIWAANMESKGLWSLSLGFQKRLWNKRGRIRLSVSDLFRTSGWYGISRLDGLTVTSSGYSDSRRLSIYFNYLLGNDRVKSKSHNTGLEDETDRLESSGSDKG